MGTAKTRANNKYQKAHYDRISFLVPKGRREIIKECAQGNGMSLQSFLNQIIDERLEKDGYGWHPDTLGTGGGRRGGHR